MQRALAFCKSIKDSKAITQLFNDIHDHIKDKYPGTYVVSARHMDGTMLTIKRDKLLAWLEKDLNPLEGRLLTNVRCLREGVNIPALDAVLFLSPPGPHKSPIDIVQSIGRVMRTSPGKKLGFIIIPVLIQNKKTFGDDIFSNNYPEYQAVWNVIKGVLANDESFVGEILNWNNKNAEKYNKKERLIFASTNKDQNNINNFDNNFDQLLNLIKVKIISHQELYWSQQVHDINKIYKLQKEQINAVLLNDANFKQKFYQYYELIKISNNEHLSQSAFIEMIAQRVIMSPALEVISANNLIQNNQTDVYLNTICKQLTTIKPSDLIKLEQFYELVKNKVTNINPADSKQFSIMDIYNQLFKKNVPKEILKLGTSYELPPQIVDFFVSSITALISMHFQEITINSQKQTTTCEVLKKLLPDSYIYKGISYSSELYKNSYHKAFRWSADNDNPNAASIIGFVTDGEWLTGVSGAWFRKSIERKHGVRTIYVINLQDNWKKANPIFGWAKMAIVFLIKKFTLDENKPQDTIYYCEVADDWNKFEKLNNFWTFTNSTIQWTTIIRHFEGDWLDKPLWLSNSLPFQHDPSLKKVFNINLRTCIHNWVVNFNKDYLKSNIQTTIDFYNNERTSLAKDIKFKTKSPLLNLLLFFYKLLISNKFWSLIKQPLSTNVQTIYHPSRLFKLQSHPFIWTNVYLYQSSHDILSHQRQLFLTKPLMNRAIVVSSPGNKNPWSVFIINQLYGAESICFPEYTYQTNHDGTITNLSVITDHTLSYAQSLYNDLTITKTAIFDYLYGLLNHPAYQSVYQVNLQKSYPKLIWTSSKETWWTISKIGAQLANLHLNIENISFNYNFVHVINKKTQNIYYLDNMKWSDISNTLIFNEYINIINIPTNINHYQVFGKSPIKWIMDHYLKTILPNGIVVDPNQLDNVKSNPRYLLDLVLKIINLTTQTLALLDKLKTQEIP